MGKPTEITTMKAKRRRHSSEFKAKVGLEALNGLKTIQQIAKEYQVHPVQVSDWKKVIVESAVGAFEKGSSALSAQEFESERTALNAIIGDLTVQLDFLKKKSKQLGL